MTTSIEYSPETQASKTERNRLIWVSPLAMLTAAAANLVLYAAAGSLFPEIAAWSGTGPIQIIGSTIVYLLIATLIFAGVKRLSSRPVHHYLIIASVSLLLSMGPPLSLGFGPGLPGVPPADPNVAITLGLMHILSFAISVPMFIRLARD